MSTSVDEQRPSSPLVRQLKQKFDRMTEHTVNSDPTRSSSQSQTIFPKTARVGYDEVDAVAYPLLPVCCLTIFLLSSHSFRTHSSLIIIFLSLKRMTTILVIQRMTMR